MKTLYLLRHAKSDWTDETLTDFDRPLNNRGLNASKFMGELIAAKGLIASTAISSPANRARTTADIIKENGGIASNIRFNQDIYEAHPQTLLQIVNAIDESHDSALIIGHNPGMEGLVYFLTGSLETIPTAALAVISIDKNSWKDIDESSGEVERLYRPKEEMRAA